MSNNIYDILKKMQNLEAPKQNLNESKKVKPDYIDIDKDGDKKEPIKKAAKEKSKGAVAEAVAAVEQQLSEKYMGFKKTVAAIKKGGSAENPEAVAAAIGRKKYGKEKFQKAAAAGKKLGEDYQSDMKARDKASRAAEFEKDLEFIKSGGAHRDTSDVEYDRHGNPAFDVNTRRKLEKERTYPVYRHPGIGDGMPDRPVPGQMDEGDIDESGLQAYLGKKKYGKEGMQALQKAGREGAGKEKMALLRARHDKMDEGQDVTNQYEQDPYGQSRKKVKPGNTLGAKIAAGATNMKRKAEKFVANTMGHNLERGPLDEQNYTEDMLSPKQKKIASMAGDPKKIDANDLKALRAGKKKKAEGNAFSGALDAARDAGKDKFKVGSKEYQVQENEADFLGGDDPTDQHGNLRLSPAGAAKVQNHPKYDPNRSANAQYGDHFDQRGYQRMSHDQAVEVGKNPKYNPNLPANAQWDLLNKPGNMQAMKEGRTSMREGWEEMQKYLEKKRGPESKGGEGKKAGTRYGGSAQKDDDEETDGEGQAVVKKKGRPKGTGGGAKFSFKKPKD